MSDNLVEFPDQSEPVEHINCVVSMAVFEGRLLFLKRPSSDKKYANQWRIPGGMAKADESNEDAVFRTLNEQTGLRRGKSSGLKYIRKYKITHKLKNRVYDIFLYAMNFDFPQAMFLSKEHVEMYFATPEEAAELDMAGKITKTVVEDYLKTLVPAE